MFGLIALALAVWLFVALHTGRTLYISGRSLPRMVERRSDPASFWGQIAAIGLLLAGAIVGTIYLAISN